MEKLSADKVAAVLMDAKDALLKVASERDGYKSRIDAMERQGRVMKLAEKMHSKGIDSDTPINELADRLEKSAEDLETVERAVDLTGPDMSSKIAKLAQDHEAPTTTSNGGGGREVSELEQWILGSIG